MGTRAKSEVRGGHAKVGKDSGRSGRKAHFELKGKGVKAGVCTVCGCEDDRGCLPDAQGQSCSWANKGRTLCSRCVGAYFRVTEQYAADPDGIPMYGLWCVDGGPDSRGHWMMDTSAIDCDNHPAVFYDLKLAEQACKEEMNPKGEGLGAMGWSVVVVELRWKEPKQPRCEGCGAKATTSDSEGVPLCGRCMRQLVQESKAKRKKR